MTGVGMVSGRITMIMDDCEGITTRIFLLLSSIIVMMIYTLAECKC